MVKSDEGTKLLQLLRPAIAVIPGIDPPMGAVSICLLRSPSRQNKYGRASWCFFTYYVAKFPYTE